MAATLCSPTGFEAVPMACNANPTDHQITVPSDCELMAIVYLANHLLDDPRLEDVINDQGGNNDQGVEVNRVENTAFASGIWYVVNPTTGTHDIRLERRDAPSGCRVGIFYLKGVVTATPDGGDHANSGSQIHNASIVGDAGQDFMVGGVTTQSGIEDTQVTGHTTQHERVRIAGGAGCSTENYLFASDDQGSPFAMTLRALIASSCQAHAFLVNGTAGAVATLDQEGYRFRNDDGSESGATWKAAQDTNISEAANTNVRLRVLVDATNDPASSQFRLEVKKSSDPDTSFFPIGTT